MRPLFVKLDSKFCGTAFYQTYTLALVAALSIAAGLGSLLIVGMITWAVQRRKQEERLPEGPDAVERAGRGWKAVFRSRYVLLAFPLGFALGFYLLLDLALAVSVYPLFVAVYAALWCLVTLLLLWGAPARRTLAIVGLVAVVVFSVRFVNWNSRKPFLKDLFRIKEGMSAAEVDQIMGDYMTGGGVSMGSPRPRLDGQLAEQGATATGTISYRHTNEGWGNSDWGEVSFENGRVGNVLFSPD